MLDWQYHPYILLTLAAMGAALVVSFFVWQRRKASGAMALMCLMLALALAAFGLTIEIGGLDVATKFLGLRWQYTGTTLASLCWVAFTLHYTGRANALSLPQWLALVSVSALSLFLAWTNPWHQWFMKDVVLDTSMPIPILSWGRGWWFWVDLLYTYGLLGFGAVLLVREFTRFPRLYQRQVKTLLAGLFIFWLVGILYVIKVIPPYVPLGPVVFVICALVVLWGLFQCQFLDITPVARDTLIEAMADAVLVLDTQQRLVDLNPAACWLLGAEVDDLVGQPAGELPPFIANLLEATHPDGALEVRITRGQGHTQRWYDVNIIPLADRKQHWTGHVLVLHDVTKLHVALEQAQVADQAKSQFVNNVSHELRTPLTNIKLYLDLLGRGKPDRYAFYLETLHREAGRLQGLIENLLNVSRLDLGKIELDPRPIDINAMLKTLVQDREPLFESRDLDIEIDLHESLGYIMADAKLLEQVFTNLLTNALNYTPPGGKVCIRTTCQVDNGRVWTLISVQDTGRGIAPDEQTRLFTRFYRGAASREPDTKAPGTGLGLAISKEIVDLHQGHITLDSAPGLGSTFTVWLPSQKNSP